MRTEVKNVSTDIRNDFMFILANVGGVMTCAQAQKILSILGEHELPDHKYRPEAYLMGEIKAKRLSLDKERHLVALGSSKGAIIYDKAALWGVSCVLDFVDNAGDLTSIRQYLSGTKVIDFVFEGSIYKLIYATHSTTAQVAQVIASTEDSLKKTAISADIIRPHYLILITDSEKEFKDLTMSRIEDLQIGYAHTIVTVSGGLEADKPQFEYYESNNE